MTIRPRIEANRCRQGGEFARKLRTIRKRNQLRFGLKNRETLKMPKVHLVKGSGPTKIGISANNTYGKGPVGG